MTTPTPPALSRSAELDERSLDIVFDAGELPEDEREAFIVSACRGEPRLLALVRRRLDPSGRVPGGFLGAPVVKNLGGSRRSDADLPSPGDALLSGRRFSTGAKQYELLFKLGAGSFGVVWLARDIALDRQVALKLFHADPADDRRLRRVLDEARAASAIEHENVVRIHDAGRFIAPDADWCYIDMQPVLDTGQDARWRLPGASMLDPSVPRAAGPSVLAVSLRIRARPEGFPAPLAPFDAARIIAQVARGLTAAHARGFVHRDIKPGNILLDGTRRALLTDFGIAAARHSPTARPGHGPPPGLESILLAHHGEPGLPTHPSACWLVDGRRVTGTPEYMSPEQARGEPATPLSDIYSLGATLAFALTGEDPYPRESSPPSQREGAGGRAEGPPNHADPTVPELALETAATRGNPRADIIRRIASPMHQPRTLPASIPLALRRICECAMDKNPQARYTSASELARDLDAFAMGRVTPIVGPTDRSQPVRLFLRRHWFGVSLTIAAVLALVLMTAWYIASLNLIRRAESRGQQPTAVALVEHRGGHELRGCSPV